VTTPVLETRRLSGGYDRVPVVRDLNIRVNPGELVALLGPNGAGKTTSLLTISGLLPALDGQVLVDGKDVTGLRPHKIARLGVAHVPEERALFQALTVADNLRLGVRGHRRVDMDEAVKHTPVLRKILSRRAGLLSGGEQQMLALARALMSKPKLLMVDEMSLGLAPIVVQSLLSTLTDIAAEQGCGVLLVEQHVSLALSLVNRAYVLAHGAVLVDESAETLRNNMELLNASYLGEVGDPARESNGLISTPQL
jgi:branched-chain amino acid transport system ATP-binding protein